MDRLLIAATAGASELPALLLRLTVAPKVAPPSVDLLYKISFPGIISSHTTYTFLNDAATNSHFGGHPISGLVTSFSPCGAPGLSMELLPQCE
jgi:hypothetical protein